jgi:hypothetical protein
VTSKFVPTVATGIETSPNLAKGLQTLWASFFDQLGNDLDSFRLQLSGWLQPPLWLPQGSLGEPEPKTIERFYAAKLRGAFSALKVLIQF